MAGLSADRPSEVVLAALVARQFYLEGVSKVDIADRLGISRFRVARLLESARETGLVRIEIGLPGGILDAGLSAELCSVFGLRQAFVFNFPDDAVALRQRLGEAAAQVLMDLIKPGDILGLTWSRTLSGLAAALTQLPPCPIVQMTGAVPPPCLDQQCGTCWTCQAFGHGGDIFTRGAPAPGLAERHRSLRRIFRAPAAAPCRRGRPGSRRSRS